MQVGRILITGKLRLISPAIFGSGESEFSDMDIIRDSNGIPYIPATSFAGIIRHNLKRLFSDEKTFYSVWGTKEYGNYPVQSSILFSDLFPEGRPEIRIRDGVAIDNKWGIAREKAKYDYEIIERGTTFGLKIEINLREENESDSLKLASMIYDLLRGGKFKIGAKTSNGFGRFEALDLQIIHFNFRDAEDVRNWFVYLKTGKLCGGRVLSAEPVSIEEKEFSIEADFIIKNSLLIREYSVDPDSPDTVHLTSAGVPVIAGSSLKGALRARAERILKTLDLPLEILDVLFGTSGPTSKASRKGKILVEETPIFDYPSEVQTRLKIDRFTGGSIEGALVETKPLFSKKEPSHFRLTFRIKDYKPEEAGLLLLVLKDLWMGDLPIGGEKAIGRGVLKGKFAKICFDGETIEFEDPSKLEPSKKKVLQGFVDKLIETGGKNYA